MVDNNTIDMSNMSNEELATMLGITDEIQNRKQTEGLLGEVKQINQDMGVAGYFQDYAPLVGEIGGSIAGGLKGAAEGFRMPGPPWMKLTNAGRGAVVGAMGGRLAGEVVADISGDDFDILDTATNVVMAGATSYAGEKIFQGAAKGIEVIREVRAGGRALDPSDAKSIEALHKAFDERGLYVDANGKLIDTQALGHVPEGAYPLRLTPAMLTRSPLTKKLESMAKVGIGGGSIDNVYAAIDEGIQKVYTQLSSSIADTTKLDTGRLFQETIDNVENSVTSWAEGYYKALDAQGAGVRLNMKEFLDGYRGTLASKAAKAGQVNRGAELGSVKVPFEDPKYVKLLKDLNMLDNSQTYAQVFGTMKSLNNTLRDLRSANKLKGGNETLIGEYEQLLKGLHDYVDKQSVGLGADLYDSYKAVSGVYREAMQSTRSRAMKELVTVAPEEVGKQLWGKAGQVTKIDEVFKSIDDAVAVSKSLGDDISADALKTKLRAGYVQSILEDIATATGDNAINKAGNILRQIRTADTDKANTFKAMLTPEQQGMMMKALSWTDALDKQFGGNFSLMIRGKQSQAAGTLIKAGQGLTAAAAMSGGQYYDSSYAGAAAALAILAGPAFIARVAVKGKAGEALLKEAEGAIKLFNQGKVQQAGSAAAITLATAFEGLTQSELPEDMRVEGAATASDALLFKELGIDSPQFGFPVTGPNAR